MAKAKAKAKSKSKKKPNTIIMRVAVEEESFGRVISDLTTTPGVVGFRVGSKTTWGDTTSIPKTAKQEHWTV